MSTDQSWPEKLGGERRRRRHTAIDSVTARKRKTKTRKASKVARATRKKQRR